MVDRSFSFIEMGSGIQRAALQYADLMTTPNARPITKRAQERSNPILRIAFISSRMGFISEREREPKSASLTLR